MDTIDCEISYEIKCKLEHGMGSGNNIMREFIEKNKEEIISGVIEKVAKSITFTKALKEFKKELLKEEVK